MAAVTVPALEPRPLPVARRGPAYWLHGYWRMFVWDLVNLRLLIPGLTVLMICTGAGFVLGIGLFFRQIPQTAAVYVATGVPIVNLLSISLILEPQMVAEQRAGGSYEFLRSMPVPRSMMAMAWYTVSLIPAIPAIVVALAVGVARYHFQLHVTPMIVPAILATSFTGMLMGYALAHGVRNPMITQMASVMLIFVIFGFSPIMFPASQLPHWLAVVNRWLPFESMTTVVRSALVRGIATEVGRAYAVLAAWSVVCGLIAARAVGHRR
jgi:ABC-2 type transport system permease protein